MILGHTNFPKKPDNMYYQAYYGGGTFNNRQPGPTGGGGGPGGGVVGASAAVGVAPAANHHHHHHPSPSHHLNTNAPPNHHAFVPETDPSVLIARQNKFMEESEQNKLPPISAWNDYRSPYKPPQYHASSKMAHQQVNFQFK